MGYSSLAWVARLETPMGRTCAMSRNVIVSTFLTLDGVMEAPENWTSDFH